MPKHPSVSPPPRWAQLTGIHPSFTRRWSGSLALWGAGAGIYVLYILSVTPLVKREFLTQVPVTPPQIGSYYEDKRPASDRPV
ncbi:hypothetical protein EXIGLDRAFT_835769 [Exidia glandulosa HHB12029]|uniref:Uncharacterized protein n=1 Tax=Exidia glandulosa HHB12029 TaxID=1314781 RepID=A0A165IG15_EXIGL|nr:hypothetical protein EXIGLDRAFT_835769 [Exidia glandulosa HHB12029]